MSIELQPIKRVTVTLFEPTPEQAARNNPIGKAAILAWYERRKRILEKRLVKAVKVQAEYFVYEVDFDAFKFQNKEIVVGKKEKKVFILDYWKLSQQDYVLYLANLEQMFVEKKAAHNKKMREAKHATETVDRKRRGTASQGARS